MSSAEAEAGAGTGVDICLEWDARHPYATRVLVFVGISPTNCVVAPVGAPMCVPCVHPERI